VDKFLLGAVSMACLVAGLFFLRFWRETQDRFFVFFGLSFFIEMVNRAGLAFVAAPSEASPFFYLVRFASYVLILIAIVDKNRQR
jgi:hypothetical protein